MTVYIGARTDAGKRDNNEDCVAVIRKSDANIAAEAILIIADGMGGRASGEHASLTAVETIKETLESLLATGEGQTPPYEDALATAMRRANARVYEMSRAKAGQKGMGTTCITAVIGEDSVSLAHIGDSRAYMLRDGILRRLTEDHSYIQDQVRSGNLSDHDARHSRFRHVITKAIGVEATIRPDFQTHELREGDILLLCTDGLSGVVDEAGMIQIMSRTLNSQAASEYLIDAAKRQGSRDNISSIVARYGGEPEPPMPDPPIASEPESPANGMDEETDFAMPAPTRARPSFVYGFAFFALGVIVTLFLLSVLDMIHHGLRESTRNGRKALPAAVTPAAASTTAGPTVPTDYLPPRVLLSKPVVPDIIGGSSQGVVVAEADNGDLWSVNSIGQVREVGNIDVWRYAQWSDRTPMFFAVDDTGRTYVSSRAGKAIRRYAPDGTFERTIDQGLLSDPQALWVSPSGDIYVIDNGELSLISGTNAPAPATRSSGPHSTAGSGHAPPARTLATSPKAGG